MDILVTNNPLIMVQYQGDAKIDFLDTDLLGVLIYIRDHIHRGHRLLTHPLSGSVKPNENIYKSVLITGVPEKSDIQSITMIEECILMVQKFPKREIPEQYLKDMQTVDFSLINK